MNRRRPDLFERLSKDDPNYEIAKRFYLEAWADSHGLVADGYAGRASLSDAVRRLRALVVLFLGSRRDGPIKVSQRASL
jgi:chloramphenicol 3-O-phosphotransferase